MREYDLIKKFYGDKRTKRTGVLLIHHIDEGLAILDALGASENAKKAFCIHPIIQADADVASGLAALSGQVSGDVMALAMEYRWVANNWLSDKVILDDWTIPDPKPSALWEVNQMLVADKVQNRYEFELNHKNKHPRSIELEIYFEIWLKVLGVSEDDYTRLTSSSNRSA